MTTKRTKRVLRYKPMTPFEPPSDVRISTISALAGLNADVDQHQLYLHLPLVDKDNPEALGVFELKYYDKDSVTRRIDRYHRWGTATGDTTEVTEVKKYFQNQLTILWRYRSETGVVKVTNGFIFNTGNIKAVGLKSDADIHLCYESLRSYLATYGEAIGLVPREEGAALELVNPRATMFNTDFMASNKVLREEMFRLILKEYHLEDSEFEMDIYPAVKIKFAWNADYMHGPGSADCVPGVCYCTKKCTGKGCGTGDGQCKVVTVCVFGNDTTTNTKMGKIIITGANQYRQVLDVHRFMSTLLETHHERLFYREPYMETVEVEETGHAAGQGDESGEAGGEEASGAEVEQGTDGSPTLPTQLAATVAS